MSKTNNTIKSKKQSFSFDSYTRRPNRSNEKVIGANEVVIYNFMALLTIDTNINQFIKVYHIFYKLQ